MRKKYLKNALRKTIKLKCVRGLQHATNRSIFSHDQNKNTPNFDNILNKSTFYTKAEDKPVQKTS